MTHLSASAQPIVTITSSKSPSDYNLLTFNVDPGTLAGEYDTIGLEIHADPGTSFNQTANEQFISGPSDDSGLLDDVIVAGGNVAGNGDSETQIGHYGFTFLGTVDLSLNAFDVAQVVIDGPGSGTFWVGFARIGNVVTEVTGTWQIPEPSTFALVVLGSMAFSRRRRICL